MADIMFYTEIYRDYPLLFSVAQRNILTVHRETLTQYITLKGGICILVLCRHATVTSCIDPSVRIVTKSPKVQRPLLIISVSWFYIIS